MNDIKGEAAKPASFRVGSRVEKWKLTGKADKGASGANGDVFFVAARDGTKGVLKVQKARFRGKSGAYNRWVDEVSAMQNCSALGLAVLPLLAAHVPSAPAASDPPYFVMPVAKRLRDAVTSESGETIVARFAEYAKHLQLLHNAGLFHRDIKPENLFLLDGREVFGDLGLVYFEGKQAETLKGEAGKPLGSRGYIAPEAWLAHWKSEEPSDLGAVDVYALAKSLFAVLQNQPLPFEGEFRATYSFREFGRLGASLDSIMMRATADNPAMRPSATELSRELQLCVALSREATGQLPMEAEVSDLARLVLAPGRQAAETEKRIVDGMNVWDQKILGELRKTCDPLVQHLGQLTVGTNNTFIWGATLGSSSYPIRGATAYFTHVCFDGRQTYKFYIWLGINYSRVTEDKVAMVAGVVMRGYVRRSDVSDTKVLLEDQSRFAVHSEVEAQLAISNGLIALETNRDNAIRQFLTSVKSFDQQ